MRFSLRTKIAAIIFVISLAFFLLISLWGYRIIYNQTRNTMINSLYRDANYLATSYRINSGLISQGSLESMAYSSGTSIWIVDTEGNVEAYSGSETVPQRVASFSAAEGTGGYYMVGNFYGTFPETMITVYAPLSLDLAPQGYVILHYPDSRIRTETDGRLRIAYISAGGLVFLLCLFGIILDLAVIRPVRQVRKSLQEYVNGNLSYPNPVKNRDEIGDLADAAENIARQLVSAGDDQRRFLANISHDFRSPLTSIRGYIVAMQDGTIPPEMQGKYFDIVTNETDRLTKLANSLLDITQVEKGFILDRSVFDINDLIREVLPTFEGDVLEKGIEFDLTFEEEHQNVSADRARIQQVLYNLVDNAIKFSGVRSTFDISTSFHNDRVFVSVRDHGIGIARENLPKIWDRFYKTDTSRGRDKKGTGLGLSIVREIIQAHGENIDVISTPGIGTEFIFTLQSA